LIDEGVRRFVEIGPGKVLSGLIRQINRDCQTLNVEDPESLDATLAALGQ
jgi:[acyl-carrier-protein] S-malonyltransferase